MKYLLSIITILSFSTLTLVAQPKMEIDKKSHDFGEVLWKKPSTVTFNIKNSGDKPLVISNVTTSCGCTLADWTKAPIMPGKSGFIATTYDAKLLGHFNKSVGIYSNASNLPVYLSIKGEVTNDARDYSKIFPYQIGSIRLNSEEITFDDVNKGDRPVVEIMLANTSDKAYTPVLMHLPSYMSAVAIPEKIGRRATGVVRVTIDTKKLPKFGLTTASVYLAKFPGDKVGDDNEIPVSVVLLPDFSKLSENAKVNPPVVNLSTKEVNVGELAVQQKRSQTVLIKNEGHSNLEIRDLQVFNSALGVQLNKRTIKPGATAKMKVTVYGHNLAKVKGTPRILMITNDPKSPKIIIRAKATLKK